MVLAGCRRLTGRIQAVELISDGNTKVSAALVLPQHRQCCHGQLRVLAVLWSITNKYASWYRKVSRLLANLLYVSLVGL